MFVSVCSDVLSYVKSKNLEPVTVSVELPPKLSAAKLTAATAATVSAVRRPAATTTTTVGQSGKEYIDIELTSMRSVIASRLTLSKVGSVAH